MLSQTKQARDEEEEGWATGISREREETFRTERRPLPGRRGGARG